MVIKFYQSNYFFSSHAGILQERPRQEGRRWSVRSVAPVGIVGVLQQIGSSTLFYTCFSASVTNLSSCVEKLPKWGGDFATGCCELRIYSFSIRVVN